MSKIFGSKLKKLREVRGISQTELARMIGYSSNGYISDIEKGEYIPPNEDKLRGIARSLDVSFDVIKDMVLESRLDDMGIRGPGFVSMFKDYPRLTRDDRREIMRTYLKIKSKQRRRHGRDN